METSPGEEAEPAPSFPDRYAAGARLAAALLTYRGTNPLVLGIPRGGVLVAAEVARRLEAELDVVIARKLEVPDEPELAMGALTADGEVYVNEYTIAAHDVTPEQLAAVIAREAAQVKEREERFRGERPPLQVANRTVIVVDDGLATGATMRATLRALRMLQPARLVAAVPVGPPDTCQELQQEADEIVCLSTPAAFSSVGSHYDDFRPLAGETVQQVLQEFDAGGHSLPALLPCR
jgi:putative phosphoribosyl transferase